MNIKEVLVKKEYMGQVWYEVEKIAHEKGNHIPEVVRSTGTASQGQNS